MEEGILNYLPTVMFPGTRCISLNLFKLNSLRLQIKVELYQYIFGLFCLYQITVKRAWAQNVFF